MSSYATPYNIFLALLVVIFVFVAVGIYRQSSRAMKALLEEYRQTQRTLRDRFLDSNLNPDLG